jgi:hypothetical protein
MPGRWLPAVAALGAAVLVSSCRMITEQVPEPSAASTHGAGATAPDPLAGPGCTLPPSVFSGNPCPREVSAFVPQVEDAMETLIREEPQLFDLTRRRGCERCFLVLDPDRFTARMVEILNRRGLCSIYDGEELGVKTTNAWNDQYDILTFEMYLRRENGSYRSTCYPAWF